MSDDRTHEHLLSVENVSIAFGRGTIEAVSDASFHLDPGEVLAIVGESGSGKTLTSLAILGLLPPGGAITSGQILLHGEDLVTATPARMRKIRGGKIGMVFQDAMTALNPVMTVGEQIEESLRAHQPPARRAWFRTKAEEGLEEVGVPEAPRRAKQYVHEFSGGMRQRAMIALARANRPEVIIADEPTTALDVTVQARVLDALRAQRDAGAGVILITHDLGVVAEIADRVAVMYAGQIVEQAPVDNIFNAPTNPYTVGLLTSNPSLLSEDGRLQPIHGTMPASGEISSGCRFAPRCALRAGAQVCEDTPPPMVILGTSASRCHFPERATAAVRHNSPEEQK